MSGALRPVRIFNFRKGRPPLIVNRWLKPPMALILPAPLGSLGYGPGRTSGVCALGRAARRTLFPNPRRSAALTRTCDWGGGWEENEVARGERRLGRKAPTRAPRCREGAAGKSHATVWRPALSEKSFRVLSHSETPILDF